MICPKRLADILGRAEDGIAPTREDCVYLLGLPPTSREAGTLRATAGSITRRRFEGEALLLGQIGADMAPCDGGCFFCFFAKPHTTIAPSSLSVEEIAGRAAAFARGGAAGIFLMTMHRFGFERFLEVVDAARRAVPPHTEILANVGDISLDQARALREAGLTGAYHVCRLREGTDTTISPADRIRTISVIREVGLRWYNSCEPIGPEHTDDELVEQIFLGVEHRCYQHAAMRRFQVPGSPLDHHGQVPLVRLAQILAVIALATVECEETRSIAVHESNLLGLVSGANALYPEAGDPPAVPIPIPGTTPDDAGFTSALWRQSTEITTADCRRMLREAGYDRLRLGDGRRVRLEEGALAGA